MLRGAGLLDAAAPPGRGPWRSLTLAERSGPAVVALGGGHGLAAALRAVREYAGSVTAVVSVADDGGSSGRLRRDLDVVPPGDLRKCLVALAEPDNVWSEAFEHRFGGSELGGHALGNLVLVGLTESLGDVGRGARRGRSRARRRRAGPSRDEGPRRAPGRGRPGRARRHAGLGRGAGRGHGAPRTYPAGRDRARATLGRTPTRSPRSPPPTRWCWPRAPSTRACSRCWSFPRSAPRSPRPGARWSRSRTSNPSCPRPRGWMPSTTSGPSWSTAAGSTCCSPPATAGSRPTRPRSGLSGSARSVPHWRDASGHRHDPARLAKALADLLES